MDIAEIDKNFAVGQYKDDGNARFYFIPCAPFDLYGVFYEKQTERFVRLPSDIADRVNKGVSWLNGDTSGGRIRFSTDSINFVVKAEYVDLREMNHMPLTGSSGFVLLEETEKGFRHVKTFTPSHSCLGEEYRHGFSESYVIGDGKMRNYILFFPLYNDVKRLSVGLDKWANVTGGNKYRDIKPILYYGSSITQGACASRPDTCYQAIISKRNNIDYINLGFSGSAQGESVIADYISGIECSVFVCDYDYNAPNAEHLKKTHYPLYKTFRAKHPDTPVIFISRADIEHDPVCIDKMRKIIKATYNRAKKEGDKNVYFIDGKKMYAGFDRNLCTVDGCHPNDLGFYKMAKAIGAVLDKIIK